MRRRAAKPTEATLDRTDRLTALARLADRLRLHADAVRGAGAEEGVRGSPEARTGAVLAAQLDAAAAEVDLLRAGLCEDCALADVTPRVAVEARR